MLTFERHLDLLAHDTMRAIGALRRTEPAAPVPGCPDWQAGDLLTHLIEMNDIWGWLVTNRPRDFDDGFEAVAIPAEHADRLDLLEATNHHLVEALRGSGPDEPVSFFGERAPTARVARLMALETLVHSRDAEEAAGTAASPIAADVATDGIDQQLSHLSDGADAPWLPAGVTLTSSDTGASWTVLVADLDDDDATLRVAQHDRAGAHVTAPASVLLQWLFARTHDATLVSDSGDPDLLRSLRLALGHDVARMEPAGRRRWWRR